MHSIATKVGQRSPIGARALSPYTASFLHPQRFLCTMFRFVSLNPPVLRRADILPSTAINHLGPSLLAHDILISTSNYGGSRVFSSRKDSGILVNEILIKALMRRSRASSAEEVQVRLVIDENPPQKPTVEILSLHEAIQVSIDRATDLVGTQINADPPVIRAVALSKLEYHKEQNAAKNNKNHGKQAKSFRFRANIGDHDLERKVADMIKFLSKGIDCNYSVFSNNAAMRRNANAGMELVERIQELVSDVGALKRGPDINPKGNDIRVKLEPLKGK